MNSKSTKRRLRYFPALACIMTLSALLMSSSHREAPLISNDPLADNTDLYAFRSPDDPNKVVLIANYIPAELPQGGPNFYTFGENIRYEIHIDNNILTPGDDIIYRFTFKQTNQDPSTFFNIRLGKQNLYTTYTCQRSTNGGASFSTIVSNGVVPPNNIGPRSIEGLVGLKAMNYNMLMDSSIATASSGEKIFCGPVDDPFFVDLGGVFDLGDAPRQSGKVRDGLARYNVHAICIQADIATLQKRNKPVSQASGILDPNYVIGVWASASRLSTKTLNTPAGGTPFSTAGGGTVSESGKWVQVSRLGMPLTNEVLIPIGKKDLWNALTPYQDFQYIGTFGDYFFNPELALYMDDSKFGKAIPALRALRIQSNSLNKYDFRNGNLGVFSLKGSALLTATALDMSYAGGMLLPAAKKPRAVDVYPIFHTGVPNLPPYQLATGKKGNPFAFGKPVINNFLPNGGDMLRLNMAVPPTNRKDANFSSLGLLQAAALGLTSPLYNGNTNLQFIPNMDGFPNGRRLEDDVTRIELQVVGGVVLAAIGFWYDDFNPANASASPVTNQLINTLQYSTGVEKNDTSFKTSFPYLQTPWRGTDIQGQH
ncbi:MAG: DUF4331 domain-containing protein [Chitinophagaceae bacterium]